LLHAFLGSRSLRIGNLTNKTRETKRDPSVPCLGIISLEHFIVFPLSTAKKKQREENTYEGNKKHEKEWEKMFLAKQHKFLDEQFYLFFRETTCSCCFSSCAHMFQYIVRTASRICSTKDVQKSCDARVHATTGAMSYRCTIVIALTVVFVVCVLFYSTSSACSVSNRYSWETSIGGSAEYLVNTKIWMNDR